MIALRDPESCSEETALVQPGLLGVLALMDGTRTLEDLRLDLVRQGAGFVDVETLAALVESLDRHLLLESERFRDHVRAGEREFAGVAVRAPTHAGGAYPEEPEAARAFLSEMLDPSRVEAGPAVRRLIAPHIDLSLGADVYAEAHRRLAASGRPDVVVVLGVCHALCSRRFIACRKDFATPLGTVRHDPRILDALEARLGEDLTEEQLVHRDEHSVEFQALWLAHLWPDDPPALVPILVGSFHDLVLERRSPRDEPSVEAFVTALREVLGEDERRVGVIASVDFSHLGPRYGQALGLEPSDEVGLEIEDRDLIEHVEAGDADGFFAALAADGNARNVCGAAPVYVTLRLGDGTGELLRYGQGRIDPGSGSVVSFAALAFAG